MYTEFSRMAAGEHTNSVEVRAFPFSHRDTGKILQNSVSQIQLTTGGSFLKYVATRMLILKHFYIVLKLILYLPYTEGTIIIYTCTR
jgi:hypothetical protein